MTRASGNGRVSSAGRGRREGVGRLVEQQPKLRHHGQALAAGCRYRRASVRAVIGGHDGAMRHDERARSKEGDEGDEQHKTMRDG